MIGATSRLAVVRRRLARGIHLARGAGFPWPMPVAEGTSVAARTIRRAARRHVLAAYPAVLRPLAVAVMALAWPVQSAAAAWHEAGRVAPGGFPRRGRFVRAGAAWRAALRHNIPPLEFFMYRMGQSTAPLDAWLLQSEMPWLLARLAERQALELAADKLAFVDFCRDVGLRPVRTIAVIRPGQPVAEPAEPRVVLKPRRGSNSRGVGIWLRDAAGWRPAGEGGAAIDWPALAAQADGEVLVQPVLQPHPDLPHFGGIGSPAARIVTGLWPEGRVELVTANFAFPRAGAVASNGGDRHMVDLGSGRLLPPGAGRLDDVFGESFDSADVAGTQLPGWNEAVGMVLAGHRAFPRAVMLGWDVAFTPEGPVLIETNTALSFLLEQYETLVPAGGSNGARLLAAWLQ